LHLAAVLALLLPEHEERSPHAEPPPQSRIELDVIVDSTAPDPRWAPLPVDSIAADSAGLPVAQAASRPHRPAARARKADRLIRHSLASSGADRRPARPAQPSGAAFDGGVSVNSTTLEPGAVSLDEPPEVGSGGFLPVGSPLLGQVATATRTFTPTVTTEWNAFEGLVRFKIGVRTDGSVAFVRFVAPRPQIPAVEQGIAVEVRKVQFRPCLLRTGDPVACVIDYSISFTRG
jgi:hypothetical protein